MGKNRSVGRSGLVSLAGSVISAAMGFAFTFIVSQNFGASGAGVVFQTIAIFSITWGLAKLGMDSVSIYLLPRLISDGTPRLGANVRWILTVALGASLMGAAGIFLLRQVLATQSGTTTMVDQLTLAVGFVALFIPAAVLSQVLLSMARGMGDITAFVTLGSVGLPVLRVLLAFGGVALGVTPALMAVAWALPFPIIAAAAAVVVWRQIGHYRAELKERYPQEYPQKRGGRTVWAPMFYPSVRQRKEVLRYGWPRTVAAGVEQLNQWLDVLIVGALAGVASSGVYGGVMRMMAAGLLVDNALRAVVSPMYSSLLHRGAMAELTTIFRQTTQWLVVASNAIYLTMATFAPVVLGWLGPDFIQGEAALVIVTVASSLILTFGNVHSLLLMSGRSGLAAFNKVIALIVGIGLMALLLPPYGLVGAAIGRAIGMALDALLAGIQVRRLTTINLVNKEIWWVYFISALLIAVPQLGVRLLMGPTASGLMAGIAVSGLLLVLWWMNRMRSGRNSLPIRPTMP